MKHSSVAYDDYQPLPMDAETLATSSYIAREPCGCVMAMIAVQKYLDARTVAAWLERGGIIDRVPDQWIRNNGFQRCEAHKSPAEQRRMEL